MGCRSDTAIRRIHWTLAIIFQPKRVETEGWRTLHNGEIHNLYASPKMIKVTKST
jgi:hypothetical protein